MRLKLTGTAAGGMLLLPDDLLVQGDSAKWVGSGTRLRSSSSRTAC